jgi:hypothetical protein
MMEPISWPRRHSDSPEWLVPARDNIQRALLRIKELLAALPQNTDAVHASPDEGLLNMMLGAAFSLWRTVFQAGHQYDQGTAVSSARDFVDEVVRNNAAIHAAELNAWLLGYYLSDARFRLVQVAELLGRRNLDLEFLESYRLMEIGPSQPMFTPERWGQCFAVLLNLLLSYERKVECMRIQTQTQSETSSMDRKPKRPPTVVGDTPRRQSADRRHLHGDIDHTELHYATIVRSHSRVTVRLGTVFCADATAIGVRRTLRAAWIGNVRS